MVIMLDQHTDIDILECNNYHDLNNEPWVIKRYHEGFDLIFFGKGYLEQTIALKVDGIMVYLPNTGIYRFITNKFEDFYDCRNMILNKNTNEIMSMIVDLMEKNYK